MLEAKGIKEHWFKPYIKKIFDKKVWVSLHVEITVVKDFQRLWSLNTDFIEMVQSLQVVFTCSYAVPLDC